MDVKVVMTSSHGKVMFSRHSLPHLRVELDEKMRVFDARMLADMRPALERRNITAMLETVHR